MEFYLEKHSSSSVIRQIQEQIKMALIMGVLRKGDTLPSIRDVEKQTGVNRGLVYKAYLDLRSSGLLRLARGKGTIVSTDSPSPSLMTEKCKQMSIDIVSEARQVGISPTAFARYLSRHAQEEERRSPFIAYLDAYKENAMEIAERISQLWQVPVVGLTIPELEDDICDDPKPQKVLVNFLYQDRVRSLFSDYKIDVIPISTRGSQQTTKALARIKDNSSLLFILPPDIYAQSQFIAAQFPKLITSDGVEISYVSAHTISNFEELLYSPKYDLLLVGPGVHEKVPQKLRTDPRVLLMHMEFDPASVEAARVRAGVII
jgi:GntR family transcriptional regulator